MTGDDGDGDSDDGGPGEAGPEPDRASDTEQPDPDPADPDAGLRENDPERFDRLPATAGERTVAGRATRREVIEWWVERFGVDRERFDEYTFWEKGSGKVWAFSGEAPSPTRVEAVGMVFLRTRQEHWKPTTDAVQRFAADATRNVIDLEPDEARRFLAGENQAIERWDGDWGYLIAAHEVAGERAPIGVGLYTYGELKSMMPKGRRRESVAGDAG